MPLVSILIPVFNADNTLAECIRSIESQSLDNYEVIVVNDSSTDTTSHILKKWANRDARVKVLQSPGGGIVAALNHGLMYASTPIVARMDADDIMYPHRLQKQLAYLQSNRDCDLVACQVVLFPNELIKAGYKEYIRWQNLCLTHSQICNQIFVESPFAHPSVMFRKESIIQLGGYRAGAFPEDYDLWLRMHDKNCKFYKIPEVLLSWRESQGRASRVDLRYARPGFNRLRAVYLSQDKRLKSKRPLAIWGAGRRTRQRVANLMEYGHRPNVWIDIDPNKIGNKIDGVWVRAPNVLDMVESESRPFVLCYVNNHGARDLIAQQLSEYNYQCGLDYLMVG